MRAEYDARDNPRTTPSDTAVGKFVSEFVAEDADVHDCHQAYEDVVGRVTVAALPAICTAALEMARRHGIATGPDSYLAVNPDGDMSIVVHLHRTEHGEQAITAFKMVPEGLPFQIIGGLVDDLEAPRARSHITMRCRDVGLLIDLSSELIPYLIPAKSWRPSGDDLADRMLGLDGGLPSTALDRVTKSIVHIGLSRIVDDLRKLDRITEDDPRPNIWVGERWQTTLNLNVAGSYDLTVQSKEGDACFHVTVNREGPAGREIVVFGTDFPGLAIGQEEGDFATDGRVSPDTLLQLSKAITSALDVMTHAPIPAAEPRPSGPIR